MTPVERVRAALERYEQQGFSSVKVDAIAGRVGVTEGAVLAAERAGKTVQRRAGASWVVLQPPHRNLRALREASEDLEDRAAVRAFDDRKARAGGRR